VTHNAFDHLDTVDMAAEGFKIAFGVMSLYTKQSLEDPDFVTYEVNLDHFEKLLIKERIPVPFHKCTEEDFAAFYDIRKSDLNQLSELKENGVLNCMDLDQALAIRGADEIDSVILNIDYVRCDKNSGGKCEKLTLDKLRNYLDHPELVLMFNQQRFNKTEYVDDPIVKESIIWNQHIDKQQANWMSTYFSENKVDDSTGRLGFMAND
jgi:hypothetical protein